jgi:hypothetical protein
MLRSITWAAFGEAAFILLIAYYCAISCVYFRKEIRMLIQKWTKRISLFLAATIGLEAGLKAQTADGNNGINQANTMVRSYFDASTQLLYALGAIVGLYGAFRVFSLWNNHHRDEARSAAMAWFGSCIFLVVVASVIRSFFGL